MPPMPITFPEKPPTNLPDYKHSVHWVRQAAYEYGINLQMLNEHNKDTIKGDWEPDETESLFGAVMVPRETWNINMGKREYEVKAIYLDTSNGWCCWNLSMVSSLRGSSISHWHSLDLRIIFEKPEFFIDYEDPIQQKMGVLTSIYLATGHSPEDIANSRDPLNQELRTLYSDFGFALNNEGDKSLTAWIQLHREKFDTKYLCLLDYPNC